MPDYDVESLSSGIEMGSYVAAKTALMLMDAGGDLGLIKRNMEMLIATNKIPVDLMPAIERTIQKTKDSIDGSDFS